MNHRVGRIAFALFVGLVVAVISYRWITNPEGREQREVQVRVVETSRARLREVIGEEALKIVDTLAPDRKVGKAYVYPEGGGWSVSGYYRRDDNERWHPYLMTLTSELALISLKVQDRNQELIEQAASDGRLEVVR